MTPFDMPSITTYFRSIVAVVSDIFDFENTATLKSFLFISWRLNSSTADAIFTHRLRQNPDGNTSWTAAGSARIYQQSIEIA